MTSHSHIFLQRRRRIAQHPSFCIASYLIFTWATGNATSCLYYDKNKPNRSNSRQLYRTRFLFHGSIDNEPPHPQTPKGDPVGRKTPSGAPPAVCLKVPLIVNRLSRHKRSFTGSPQETPSNQGSLGCPFSSPQISFLRIRQLQRFFHVLFFCDFFMKTSF